MANETEFMSSMLDLINPTKTNMFSLIGDVIDLGKNMSDGGKAAQAADNVSALDAVPNYPNRSEVSTPNSALDSLNELANTKEFAASINTNEDKTSTTTTKTTPSNMDAALAKAAKYQKELDSANRALSVREDGLDTQRQWENATDNLIASIQKLQKDRQESPVFEFFFGKENFNSYRDYESAINLEAATRQQVNQTRALRRDPTELIIQFAKESQQSVSTTTYSNPTSAGAIQTKREIAKAIIESVRNGTSTLNITADNLAGYTESWIEAATTGKGIELFGTQNFTAIRDAHINAPVMPAIDPNSPYTSMAVELTKSVEGTMKHDMLIKRQYATRSNYLNTLGPEQQAAFNALDVKDQAQQIDSYLVAKKAQVDEAGFGEVLKDFSGAAYIAPMDEAIEHVMEQEQVVPHPYIQQYLKDNPPPLPEKLGQWVSNSTEATRNYLKTLPPEKRAAEASQIANFMSKAYSYQKQQLDATNTTFLDLKSSAYKFAIEDSKALRGSYAIDVANSAQLYVFLTLPDVRHSWFGE